MALTAARRSQEQPHRGDLASHRIYHQAKAFQGQSSEQWRYIRRPKDDLRGAAPIAEFEERFPDVICAASAVSQRELFAIQFREPKLASYRTRDNAVDCACIDQKFELNRTPAWLARIRNSRLRECNSLPCRGSTSRR
jgi:hypothetical protein